MRWRPAAGSLLKLRLDRVPDLGFDLGTVEAVDLLDTGRRGDIDLGHIIADHVDADEDETALLELRPNRLADFVLALCKFAFHRLAADMHVGARFARSRNAIDRTRGLAVDQDDALV